MNHLKLKLSLVSAIITLARMITLSTAQNYSHLGFFLKGIIYPPNASLNLTDIGVDGDSLRCHTPLISCCRKYDNPNNKTLGDWKFPNGSTVRSKNDDFNISRTRGHSSVLLHRNSNVTFPTGVYTCQIPDNSSSRRILYVYLYADQKPGLTTELEYSCFEEHITCTVYGGLVDYYNWTKDGVLIDSSDLKFQQFMRITDSVLVTPQVILSSSNRSYFQGTFRCTVRDGLGRTSYSTINFNNDFLSITSSSPIIAGGVDDIPITCSALVDCDVVDFFGDLDFIWYNSEEEVIVSSSGTIISSINSTSTLILSPLSVDDFNVTCCVVVSEGQARPNYSCVSTTFIIKDNLQTEYTSRVNTQQTTSDMLSMPSTPNITTIIITVILSSAVITVPVILITLLLCFRQSCFKKEENNTPMQFKMSERSADDSVCDNISLTDEQSKSDREPVYSVVNKHAKKTNGKDDEEKIDEMSVYYSTVSNREESIKSEVQDVSELYTAVDKRARKKYELPEGKMVVKYSTTCYKEEPNSKSEVQDASDLYAAVDKSARKNKKLPEDKVAVHYSTVCNKEEPNKSEVVQDVSDLYATVDKSAKRKEKSPDEMASLNAKADVMKKTI